MQPANTLPWYAGGFGRASPSSSARFSGVVVTARRTLDPPRMPRRERGRMGHAPLLALAVVLLGQAGAEPGARRDYTSLETAVDPQGAFECPCLAAHTNATFATLLVAKGFPATYGLQTCQAHDEKLANSITGCTVRALPARSSCVAPARGSAPDPRPNDSGRGAYLVRE